MAVVKVFGLAGVVSVSEAIVLVQVWSNSDCKGVHDESHLLVERKCIDSVFVEGKTENLRCDPDGKGMHLASYSTNDCTENPLRMWSITTDTCLYWGKSPVWKTDRWIKYSCGSPFPQVTLKYNPNPYPMLQGTSTCEYHLVVRDGKLNMVAVIDGKALDKSTLNPWTVSHEGIFTKYTSMKLCIQAVQGAQGGKIVLSSDPNEPCATQNEWVNNTLHEDEQDWHYKTAFAGNVPLCMATPVNVGKCSQADPNTWTITEDRFVIGSPDSTTGLLPCQPGWSQIPFDGLEEEFGAEQPVTSISVQSSCNDCYNLYGSFTCLLPNGTCTLVPDRAQCMSTDRAHGGLGGEWCQPGGKRIELQQWDGSNCEGNPTHTWPSLENGACGAGTPYQERMLCDPDNKALHFQSYSDKSCKVEVPGGAASITTGACTTIHGVGQIYKCYDHVVV